MPAHVRLRHRGFASAEAKAYQSFLDQCTLTEKELKAVSGLNTNTGKPSQKRASGNGGGPPGRWFRRRGGVVQPGTGHVSSGTVGSGAGHNSVSSSTSAAQRSI